MTGEVHRLKTPAAEPIDPRLVEKHRAMAEAVAPIFRDYLAAAFKPVLDRLAALEQRAETRGISMHYEGVWSRGVRYEPGATVTSDGSLWITARASVAERPGDATGGPWQLCVKNQQPAR